MDVEPAKERDGVLDTFKALRWNNSMDVESTKEENGILDTFKVLRWKHLDGLQGHGGRVRGSEQVHGPGPELPPAKVRRSAEGLDELERALEKKMV